MEYESAWGARNGRCDGSMSLRRVMDACMGKGLPETRRFIVHETAELRRIQRDLPGQAKAACYAAC